MKRGLVELSSGMIVTVVVALAILVLYLIFTATGFGSTARNFNQQTTSALTPSSSEANPLSVVFDDRVSPGAQVGMRASVYNAGAFAQEVRLVASCSSPVFDSVEMNPRDLPERESSTFALVATVKADLPHGKYPCGFTAEDAQGAIVAQTELIVEVRA